jgi:bifunctional DNase/RNase
LLIWIGPFEGTALAMSLQGAELPRPGSFQFTAALLAAAGGALQEVRVTRLVEGTFYAEAVVDGAAGRGGVDARPSDALTLALLTGAPIRVDPVAAHPHHRDRPHCRRNAPRCAASPATATRPTDPKTGSRPDDVGRPPGS